MWDGKVVSMYHYVMTDEYPYSIGCFRGTPVSVARPRGGGGPTTASAQPGDLGPGAGGALQGGGPGNGPGGPRGPGGDVLVAVARDLGVDVDTLRQAVGAPPPNIQRASRELGISVEKLRAAFRRHAPPR
jgi:hypothetical protein